MTFVRVSDMNRDRSSNGALPISPLMDDNFHKAKQRHRRPKLDPNEELSPMQKAVRKNVYARALSTPLRKCRLTGVLLPRFFLLDFHAIAHPKTGLPWYMPRGLTNSKSVNKVFNRKKHVFLDMSMTLVNNSNKLDSQRVQGDVDSRSQMKQSPSNINKDLDTPLDCDINTNNSLEDSNRISSSATRIGGGTYLLRSYQALDSLRTKTSKTSRGITNLYFLTQTIKNNPFAMKTFETTRFRPDMADFVLTLKRRRIVEQLDLVTSKFRGYITHFNPKKSLKSSQVAAVLLLDSPSMRHEREMLTVEEFRAFMLSRPKDVPVYDLIRLLGHEMLRELRNSNRDRWKYEVLTIKNRNYTQSLLTYLWELEGYLSPFLPQE